MLGGKSNNLICTPTCQLQTEIPVINVLLPVSCVPRALFTLSLAGDKRKPTFPTCLYK